MVGGSIGHAEVFDGCRRSRRPPIGFFQSAFLTIICNRNPCHLKLHTNSTNLKKKTILKYYKLKKIRIIESKLM